MNILSESASLASVEWEVATRALGGGDVSGDLYAVVRHEQRLLLAVVDGLGHGYGARRAAEAAVSALERHADQPLPELLRQCHQQLRPTRGAVMSVATIDLAADRLTWVGVGNVDACVFRSGATGSTSREVLLQRGGVVGYNLPTIRPTTVQLGHGDVLVFATDGIRSTYYQAIRPGDPPREMADEILAAHGRDTDDALVLVARYLRPPA